MAVTINANNSTGLVTTADTSAVLELQTGGTTALSISTGQVVSTTNGATIQGLTVGRGAGAVATNTAVGASALAATATGGFNTGVGANSLKAVTSGTVNTATGHNSLQANTTGSSNSAFGQGALEVSSTGSYNTAIGNNALNANTTASNNTAVGYQAGYTNATGSYNTFVGNKAGYASNVNGNGLNTCVGHQAGVALTTGTYNTFIGGADSGGAMTTGSKNSILGSFSGNQSGLDIRTASNYIVLSDGDGTPRIWHTNQGAYGYFVAPSIYNNTTGAAANVNVTSAGELYRSTSSLKYKRDVQNATHGLAEVLQLRPVTYKGKGENDGDTVFGGLIAEEVHETGLTEFVQYATDGSPDALAYGNMVSLCVKAIQELKEEFDAYKASHP
jgi:hypothetical protein